MQRETDFLARYGGEEFAAVLSNTDLDGAVKVAGEMHQAIKSLQLEHAKSKVSTIVTISMGVSAVVPQLGNEPEILVAAADQALYKAKEEGRNRLNIGHVKTS